MKRSRRRFLRLVAAGSAAALASPASALAAVAPRKGAPATKPVPKPAPAPPALPAVVAAEIEKQKGYVAAALKAVRGYALPPGSDMAFTFKPVRARRKARTP